MTDTILRVVDNGSTNITNKLIIAVSGEDMIVDYSDYNLTFDSNENAFLEAIRSGVRERFNVDIQDASGQWLYKIRKATESKNVYLIPNSVAG